MPTKKAVKERLDLAALRQEIREWYALKRQSALLEPKLKKGSTRFKDLLTKYGEKDPTDGSYYLDLEEPVGDQNIRYLKSLCVTASNVINDEAAEEILGDKGLWEELTEVIRVPQEDKIRAAYFDNKITNDELAQIFPKVTSYRFFLLDEDEKPVRA